MKENTINIRDFSRNLSFYIDSPTSVPLTVLKRGIPVLKVSKIKIKKKTKKGSILDHPAMQMYKYRKDWKGKTGEEILDDLRERAWA